MSRNETFKFLFLLQIWFFPSKWWKKSLILIDILSFLENIKHMSKFTLPSDKNIVYRYVLLVYSIIFAGHPWWILLLNLNHNPEDMIERFIYIKPGILTQAHQHNCVATVGGFCFQKPNCWKFHMCTCYHEQYKKVFEKKLVLEKMAHVHNSVKCFEYLQGF